MQETDFTWKTLEWEKTTALQRAGKIILGLLLYYTLRSLIQLLSSLSKFLNPLLVV